MDQIKIGKFISACRKKNNMTQKQLAEKLNITDRAVSRWETGKGMPDSSYMLELSDLLGITVNELLSGEYIGEDKAADVADDNLIRLKRQNEAVIRSTRISYAAVMLVLLACNIINIIQSGVQNAVVHPAFIIMDSVMVIWFLWYCVLNGKA